MNNIIELENENGGTESFYVEEETVINGASYLLVSEITDKEIADAYILKDISAPESEDAEYIFVEDEVERNSVGAIFREMLEDAELL